MDAQGILKSKFGKWDLAQMQLMQKNTKILRADLS